MLPDILQRKESKEKKKEKGGLFAGAYWSFPRRGWAFQVHLISALQHIDDNATPDIGLGRVIAATTLPATAAAAVETAEPAA